MKKHWLLLACILLSPISYAALDLELTQGVDGAIPIAIVPFENENILGDKRVTAVIESDLTHSGHFRIIDAKKLPEHPKQFTDVNVEKWRSRGIDNIVIGSIAKKADGSLEVKYELMNLYEEKSHENSSSVILNKTLTMTTTKVRSAGHHISDEIFYKLVGKKGVFSTHIAYVLVNKRYNSPSTYKLVVSDIDGNNQQALVTSSEPIMSPAWSPDGRRIAYVSFESHKPAIYVQSITSGQRIKVADYPGINGAPDWSPDGQMLALVLSKTGSPKIYTFDMQTKQLTALTDGSSIDTEPSFSPDGHNIIFTSNRGGGPQIYQVPAQGGRVERLSFDGTYNATAQYTRDGKSMVMLHRENSDYHIAVQDMTTGQIEILTNSGQNQSPSVAPNDEMVLFATKLGAKQVLGMVSIDGKIRLRIPAGEGDVREPAWSPT